MIEVKTWMLETSNDSTRLVVLMLMHFPTSTDKASCSGTRTYICEVAVLEVLASLAKSSLRMRTLILLCFSLLAVHLTQLRLSKPNAKSSVAFCLLGMHESCFAL